MKTRNIIIHFTLYFIIFACISCAQPVEDESHDDDITRLTIVSTSPANLSGNNPIDTAISITFNVPVVQTGWTITINGIDHSVSDGSFNTAGTILTIVPKVTFTWGDIANVALAGFVSDDARMMALSPEFTSFSFAIGPIVSGIIAIAGDQKVTLSWDPAANATSYNIYWSNTNGVTKYNGTKITSASNPYIHNSLTNGITYYYVITAMNAGNESVESSQVSVKPLLNPVPGNSGTITTGSVTYNSLLLSWTAGTDDLTNPSDLQYAVYQSTSGDIGAVTSCETNGTLIQNYTKNMTSKTVTGLSPSTQYYFNIILKDSSGNKTCYTMKSQTTAAPPPPGSTWTARTLPGSNWTSITYGNGTFVAIASSGSTAATSPNGSIWTTRTLPSTASWKSIAYGNGVFVAIAGSMSNKAATSPDGITWTARTLSQSAYWSSVTYGNNTFVAVSGGYSDDYYTTYSTDGTTWSYGGNLPSQSQWTQVAYGNGTFVSVASYNSTKAATSANCATWTSRTLSSGGEWCTLAFGNNIFISLDYNSIGNRALTSPDGVTWTSRTLPVSYGWSALTYGNGIFVAVGNNNKAITTTDGITWTTYTLPVSGDWKSIAYGNGAFVAVAFGGECVTSP